MAQEQVSISVDLGGERVELVGVEATEALGRPFEIVVEAFAKLGEIDFLPHLGKPVAIAVAENDTVVRRFHGLLSETDFQQESQLGYHYRLRLRPFTFYLEHNRAFAIFQDLSALDIIKRVFEAAGLSDVEYKALTRTYLPRTYCVQYGESDFSFVSRLMEEEGLYYYWRHEADRHVMVMCDSTASHLPSVLSHLEFNPDPVGVHLFDEVSRGGYAYLVRFLERVSSRGETKVVLRDFDLAAPERPVEASWSESAGHQRDAGEVFDYPGGFTATAAGTELGKTALLARRHDRQVYAGEAQTAMAAVGTTVPVTAHPVDRLNASYLLVRSQHSLVVRALSSKAVEGHERFATRFEAIPAATPFHSPRVTPRPRVMGLETAIVSGPEGETIFTDDYGRVKVRFPWDRADTTGDKSTCWVRVAQFGNLGSVILPRVGQEVMVDFLGGDPDRPVVIGWTFNKAMMPHYALPANKTRAVWRTKRYGEAGQYPDAKALDSGAPGANELRFEDKGGAEEVYLHAERDLNTRVRFAETHHVGQDQALMVGHDRTDDVGHDETSTVGHDQALTVTNNQTESVGAARKVDVGTTDKLSVGQSLTVDAQTTIALTANQSITLTVGSSSITIDQSGVSIKGLNVSVDGTATVAVSGGMNNFKSDAMTTITGLLVKIN